MESLRTKDIVIRADANTQMGMGHIMRCLALGQAWKDSGGEVVFVTTCHVRSLLDRLAKEGFHVHILENSYPDSRDWEITRSILALYKDSWMVVDGYHFDSAYHYLIKKSGHRLLVIDDMAHLEHYYADIILNQNLHAEQLNYSTEPYSRLLLGIKYVLLRHEFLAWKDWQRDIPEVARNLLVTIGGSDPNGYTVRIVETLVRAAVTDVEVTVVIGSGSNISNQLNLLVEKSTVPFKIQHNPENMAEIMAWADIAVSASGTTVWELMLLGVPAFLIAVSENQKPIAERADKNGAAVNIKVDSSGNWINVLVHRLQLLVQDKYGRAELSSRARTLVDGSGGTRVIQALDSLSRVN